jgi:hypothetical protein
MLHILNSVTAFFPLNFWCLKILWFIINTFGHCVVCSSSIYPFDIFKLFLDIQVSPQNFDKIESSILNLIYPVTALNKCGCLSPINRLSNRERKKITSTNCNIKYGKRAKSNLSNNFRHVLIYLIIITYINN